MTRIPQNQFPLGPAATPTTPGRIISESAPYLSADGRILMFRRTSIPEQSRGSSRYINGNRKIAKHRAKGTSAVAGKGRLANWAKENRRNLIVLPRQKFGRRIPENNFRERLLWLNKRGSSASNQIRLPKKSCGGVVVDSIIRMKLYPVKNDEIAITI